MKLKEGKGSSTIEMAGATLRVVDVRAQTGKEASSIAIPGLTVTDAVIEFEVVEVRGRPELVDDFGKIHRPAMVKAFTYGIHLASTFSD